MKNLLIAVSLSLATAAVQAAKPYELWYDQPAPELPIVSKAHLNVPAPMEPTPEDPAWENWSLPLGNGYLGASVFGRTVTERVQLTENSLAAKSLYGGVGLTNFAELYLDFGHKNPQNYRRSLSLNDAVARVSYEQDGVRYEREYFASYPDKVLVIKLTASRPGALSFSVRPEVPYQRPFGTAAANGRDGQVKASGNLLTLTGKIEALNLLYEGQFKVLATGGRVTAGEGRLEVSQADSAVLLVALGTNYKLESRVFETHDLGKKLSGNPAPHDKVTAIIEAAAAKPLAKLWAEHQRDYKRLFDRASIDLGGQPARISTDQLLAAYKDGKTDRYLEELYFHYGRYLLIASSRPGTLPPNLQGIWTQYEVTPWTGGYWHNINIQMNYWPVFNTNLAELFQPFVDYNLAYRKAATQVANNYIKKHNPAAYAEDNGWTIGTGASAYNISGPGMHSGPGTGAMTTKMFWDYYEFTGDKTVLRDIGYPAILGMAKFLSKVVVEKDGLLLTDPSFSPEQRSKVDGKHYQTIGSAFDQQMIYENHADALKAARLLGDTNPLLPVLQGQMSRLDPVQVGLSGQIKEYREEQHYGELVADPRHRHTSQLMGLYPGTLINANTPAWLDASRESLDRRGDRATGWGMAFRLNLWARIKDGERSYGLFQRLLASSTLNNLWDTHPPFQIDGNFGGTAGVAEMLLQSHEGYVDVLPALPAAWHTGRFDGLVARGGFEVSAQWAQGHAQALQIKARVGGACKLRYPGLARAVVTDSRGRRVPVRVVGADLVEFTAEPGMDYRVSAIPAVKPVAAPAALTARAEADGSVLLQWQASAGAAAYKVALHRDNEPDYRVLAASVAGTQHRIRPSDLAAPRQGLFRVTAVGADGRESRGSRVLLLP
jgi:alpha-L-fucosidase 2